MSTTGVRERETDDNEDQRITKRAKVDTGRTETAIVLSEPVQDVDMTAASKSKYSTDDLLPPSRSLLPYQRPETSVDDVFRISEPDVGISEYIASDVPKIEGIIKQRFTDFLVYEVDLQGDVVHLKSINKPDPPKTPTNDTKSDQNEDPSSTPLHATSKNLEVKPQPENETAAAIVPPETKKAVPVEHQGEHTSTEPASKEDAGPWPEKFTEALTPLLSTTAIEKLKKMFLEGPEPPFVSDAGWASRQPQAGPPDEGAKPGSSVVEAPEEQPPPPEEGGSRGKRGKDKRGRGGRGARGGRGSRGGRGGRAGGREDHRRVLSDPITSKQDRTALHEVVRKLFGGKLETETDSNAADKDAGQRIVIKWSKSKGSSAKRGSKEDATARGGRNTPFPYIHFTMQKTNRDTQDAISHLSRLLHVNAKDLSVSGTKDKRGVTTQRVSFKRNGKSIEDVWKAANGLAGRRTLQQATAERGERGVRVGDLAYRKGYLELGMLRGNAFVITLRNIKVDSVETMDRALSSLKENGFINYYGMQRFGTASIPTHSIGLAILRSDWNGAVSLILRPRPGEYPEAEAARRAWLEDKDLDKALSLMPRRVVAERCILENYQKQGGEDRNALGALSTIPRNLRLMYVHAYQSYVWNAIVSERIQKYGQKPIVGDLVFDDKASSVDDDGEVSAVGPPDATVETEDGQGIINNEESGLPVENDQAPSQPGKKERKPWQPPKIKILNAEDLQNYSIFDVLMPLPGTDVAYPEGPLGEKYKEFLKLDGLDPENFSRKQKDYTLGGSYRKILHLPKNLSWSVMRYIDPDVALAQSDEDKLLGYDPPLTDENGPFLALQIRLQLGTAAYATMALREVTKTETSSHHQSTLTQASDDQKFKGAGENQAT